jgi:hypothetical protein
MICHDSPRNSSHASGFCEQRVVPDEIGRIARQRIENAAEPVTGAGAFALQVTHRRAVGKQASHQEDVGTRRQR